MHFGFVVHVHGLQKGRLGLRPGAAVIGGYRRGFDWVLHDIISHISHTRHHSCQASWHRKECHRVCSLPRYGNEPPPTLRSPSSAYDVLDRVIRFWKPTLARRGMGQLSAGIRSKQPRVDLCTALSCTQEQVHNTALPLRAALSIDVERGRVFTYALSADEKAGKEVEIASVSSTTIGQPLPPVIVFEEADVVFADKDSGFYAALRQVRSLCSACPLCCFSCICLWQYLCTHTLHSCSLLPSAHCCSLPTMRPSSPQSCPIRESCASLSTLLRCRIASCTSSLCAYARALSIPLQFSPNTSPSTCPPCSATSAAPC